MAALQDTPLRIPDKWSATWFRQFVVEVLAKADVRNSIGDGVSVSSDGNSYATLSTVDAQAAALAAHVGDPFTHEQIVQAHVAEAHPHTQYLTQPDAVALQLPVGSVFLTIDNTNPATLLGYGTWTQRATGDLLLGAA
jgi:hypothetical protein